MILLSADKISKGFADRVLLDQVSLFLNDTDKVGIIGVNGTGKTTLLNLLAGKSTPDEGAITRASGARIAYLQQNPVFDPAISLLSIVLAHVDEQAKEASAHEAKTILTQLGFYDFDENTASMSEGEKKRVAIAQTLMSPCELLILDEPTNHLDSHMVQWLESYLKRYRGAIVMVTHDRYFLERVTNRIVEIDGGSLYSHDGNYSHYLERKAQREEMELASQRKNRSLYKKELEWMSRGARARSTKSKSRIERFDVLEEAVSATNDAEALKMESLSARLGKKIIELEHVSKGYEDRCLVKDFSLVLPRDARIGIIGRNGCGKSTLIKMMAGELQPDEGSVDRGATVKIGYLSQMWATPPADMRVIDYIKEEASEIVTADGVISASKMLERFLFPSGAQWTQVQKLSGGEKRRLFLLRILMGAPNVLLLDEPTNDLDTDTLTVLEDYLETFSGAVVTISHDRYFLDKAVDTILEIREGGEVRRYNGGYSDYLQKREPQDEEGQGLEPVKATKEKTAEASRVDTRPAKAKFSFSQQREYAGIEDEIAALEERLERAGEDVDRFASDYEKLLPAIAQKESLEAQLAEKMDRWVYLSELAQKIEDQRTGGA